MRALREANHRLLTRMSNSWASIKSNQVVCPREGSAPIFCHFEENLLFVIQLPDRLVELLQNHVLKIVQSFPERLDYG